MISPNDPLVKLAEAKQIIDSLQEFGTTDKDHVLIYFYNGPNKELVKTVKEQNGLISLAKQYFDSYHIDATFRGESKVSFHETFMNDVSIVKQDLRGSSFFRTKIIKSSLGKTDFTGSDFSYSAFSEVNVYGSNFTNSKFRYMKSFSKSSFSFGSFYDADWRGVDFTGTDLSWIDPEAVIKAGVREKIDFFEGCNGIDENLLKAIKVSIIRKKLF